MYRIGLQTVYRFSKTTSCFGAEAPSSWSLKYGGPEPIHQSRNKVSNIEIFKILKL